MVWPAGSRTKKRSWSGGTCSIEVGANPRPAKNWRVARRSSTIRSNVASLGTTSGLTISTRCGPPRSSSGEIGFLHNRPHPDLSHELRGLFKPICLQNNMAHPYGRAQILLSQLRPSFLLQAFSGERSGLPGRGRLTITSLPHLPVVVQPGEIINPTL